MQIYLYPIRENYEELLTASIFFCFMNFQFLWVFPLTRITVFQWHHFNQILSFINPNLSGSDQKNGFNSLLYVHSCIHRFFLPAVSTVPTNLYFRYFQYFRCFRDKILVGAAMKHPSTTPMENSFLIPPFSFSKWLNYFLENSLSRSNLKICFDAIIVYNIYNNIIIFVFSGKAFLEIP